MPGFRTHTTINLTVLTGLTAKAVLDQRLPLELVGIAAVAFAGATFFLSPDLDLRHSSPTRNWGPLRWLWRPYQLLFKHRGMSHSLLLSSVTRIAYLLGLVVGIGVCARMFDTAALPTRTDAWAFIGSPTSFIPVSLRDVLGTQHLHMAAVGLGILLSDITHIISDRTVSAFKILIG